MYLGSSSLQQRQETEVKASYYVRLEDHGRCLKGLSIICWRNMCGTDRRLDRFDEGA